MKILIGSPIKQQSTILKVFLENLEKMDLNDLDVTYYFIDDNIDTESTTLLHQFQKNHKNVILKTYKDFGYQLGDKYQNRDTHTWKKSLIERITTFKDEIIHHAQKNNFDYLFFVDSDIIMNPQTIKHLINQNVDIVSEIFWTSWNTGDNLVPQVWLQDESNLYIRNWDQEYTKNDIKQMNKDFIAMLKIPGLYEVGGLGACTLISKKALTKDLSFKCIPNISFWGEDRHFCIRAQVYGLKLHVDTVYPAYHIYRESYLSGVNNYLKNGFNPNEFIYNPLERKKIQYKKKDKRGIFSSKINTLKTLYEEYKKSKFLNKRFVNKNPKITLAMAVHNAENKFLEDTIKQLLKYVDNFVIIDNASTDNTVEIIKKLITNDKLKLVENKNNMLENKYELQKKLWFETIKTNPDWILFLETNEIFEERIINDIKYMIKNDEIDTYCFKYNDVIDDNWHPLLIRYQPKFKYKFSKQMQNDERTPKNVLKLNYINSNIKLEHLDQLKNNKKKSNINKCHLNMDTNCSNYEDIKNEN